jgi:SOS response regulatory protein OraA/RecX
MMGHEEEVYTFALKLLARRDYSVVKLREKLELHFGDVPDEVIQRLISKRFLNDRRVAENHVARHKNRGRTRLLEDLLTRGIPSDLAESILSSTEWPSLRDALNARMMDWGLSVPLHSRDAARLFRAMARLGYEEDAIREELEQLTS